MSHDLRNVKLALGRSVEEAWLRNRLAQIPDSGLFWAIFWRPQESGYGLISWRLCLSLSEATDCFAVYDLDGEYLGLVGFCGSAKFDDLACSHRLRGLPSSSGSPSLLHLRALAPQRHIVSSRQGTVEPQPPPHAHSVVAWPIARQGFYGGQPTSYPGSDLSHGRSHSPHPNVTGSYDERLTCNVSFSKMTVRDD